MSKIWSPTVYSTANAMIALHLWSAHISIYWRKDKITGLFLIVNHQYGFTVICFGRDDVRPVTPLLVKIQLGTGLKRAGLYVRLKSKRIISLLKSETKYFWFNLWDVCLSNFLTFVHDFLRLSQGKIKDIQFQYVYEFNWSLHCLEPGNDLRVTHFHDGFVQFPSSVSLTKAPK